MKEFLSSLFIIYAVLLFAAFPIGLLGSNDYPHDQIWFKSPLAPSRPLCLDRKSRVSNLFPTYRLGCWLGGASGTQYYYSQEIEDAWLENWNK